MQFWEYLFVTCAEGGTWRQPRWVPRYVNGDELPNWKDGPSIAAFSNQCGADGWELVTVVGGHPMSRLFSDYGDYRLIFKRPKF